MAHEALYIPFFLGIGVKTLSIAPRYMAQVQNVVSKWTIGKSEELANLVLQQTTISGVSELLEIPKK